jgi:hypothetical protein
MKNTLIFNRMFAVLALALASLTAFSQGGLENIIVETYYISDANDATDNDGGSLPVGSTTYRIYADLLPGYEVQAVYGNSNHELRIETSTFFFNNEDRGEITGSAIGSGFLDNNTVALDSYLAMGFASNAHFGIPKVNDTNGSIVGGVNNDGGSANIAGGLLVDGAAAPALTSADGLLPGTAATVTLVGLTPAQTALFNDANSASGLFSTNSGAWSVLAGVQGPTSANRVLLAQITTNGELSFELNLQIGTPQGGTEQYVANNPQPGEGERAFLSYPLVVEPANGQRINATTINGNYNIGSCVAKNGNLSTALASPESNSTAVTGEDQWFEVVASGPGIRVQLSTTAFDGMIELQDASGNTLATENAVSGLGGEILHFGGPLTVGATYYIAIRNFNSALGTGAYSVCVQRLRAPACNSSAPFNVCGQFKCTNTGAQVYDFTFVNTLTGVTISRSNSNGLTSTPFTGFVPGQSYGVTLACTYNLFDAAGNPETFTFSAPNACLVPMSAHADLDLRPQDECASGPRPNNATIGATAWICGASYFQWEFTQVTPSPGVPFTVNGNGVSRLLNLGGAGLTAGASYNVRIRPVFGTVFGEWGPDTQCLQIIGLSSAEANEETVAFAAVTSEENGVSASLFPNPSNGVFVNLSLHGLVSDNVQLRVIDQTGRVVYMTAFASEENTNKVITFNEALAAGIYMVELNTGEEIAFERLVVQK